MLYKIYLIIYHLNKYFSYCIYFDNISLNTIIVVLFDKKLEKLYEKSYLYFKLR